MIGRAIHGDEYITPSARRGAGIGLEWPSIATREVLVSADVVDEGIMLGGVRHRRRAGVVVVLEALDRAL